MKRKIIFILFLCLCIFPIKVNARALCSVDETLRLKKIASNLSVSYDYNEVFTKDDKYGKVSFIIKITNMHNDIRIIDKSTGNVYKNNSDKEVIINGKKAGKSYSFDIYGAYGDCTQTFLTNLYVSLPSYNKYYVDPLCKNIPNYSLCNKWNNISMTYDEFKEKVEIYLLEDDDNNEEESTRISITTFEKVISFLADWSLLIFLPIILISFGLIIYLTNKDNFDLKV